MSSLNRRRYSAEQSGIPRRVSSNALGSKKAESKKQRAVDESDS